MSDHIVTAITSDLAVRAYAIDATLSVDRAGKIHKTGPVASAALGRVLCATSMMGFMLKREDETITIQFKGDGPLGAVMGASDSFGNMWGYVANPAVDLPKKPNGKIDVSGGVGRGTLTVARSAGSAEPYCGQVPIVTGEIAEDITSYFAISEQTPTACALGVLVERDYSIAAAGGFIIQPMPFAGEDVIKKIEEGILGLPPVTAMLVEGLSPADILKRCLRLFDGVEIIDERPVSYRCRCSRDKVERALISLGKKELTELIESDSKAELTCRFCDVVYKFDHKELLELLEKAGNGKQNKEI